ncbi:bifunctional diaminohydroxyphosphoribosylaminopyrimidine deaminase/5-amino-6-(5-phosphoribosylamino)uracil reductase RibD [Spirulina sp. CS-785/01]|uniref:bifunctional diaminohydroxyphosphoribosylaminopyrimidine deaminase/5-amino-6-(5-phosphoribosylamino)uracil reductase RibD n=1 Tax=Spirulina sp. CS-785/01 TaxID=3021716 RepID=UPI00232D6FB7|nr:bifunctional diaminohydroxyphosphoribosylaminopyrimidine deaminase/5-amino-6-(5-phosphoribosylamino)uracil reductase RibD [Spirulina sp. CS-785/01]MDB9314022.1 bifunctional diaminohydroxyphosphoribosylaminopyrimidine deaminase/5-amino-6-(5-phosphoribosylamino)uracil reductase RibD [Spirulina sp. CS-785/01]
MTDFSPQDRDMMQRCITLAQQAAGRTAPNPLVGCVIVQEGQIVGQGYHPQAGQPHAEVFALREAGEAARGATVYVSLEPCNHYGRTPPCTEALIKAGVSRVKVGMVDPDPRVAGGGIKRLQEAGIAVTVGIEEAACRRLNEAFIHRILYKQPFGILKYAMTLDGKIAATSGHSAWVTGETARHWVHQQRAASDAVIVGGNTVRKDNPRLTTHGITEHNPLRVVMSRQLNLPEMANLWETEVARTVVFTEMGANPAFQGHLEAKGVEVVTMADLSPQGVMESLFQRGCSQVFWECGGRLAAKAIQGGAVQKVCAFVAPKLIGGVFAPSPMGDLGLEKMTEALRLEGVTVEFFDSDLLITGYLGG